ncbi:MAG: hypothetical protein ACK5L5_08980 [Bacteroidales bacterium]
MYGLLFDRLNGLHIMENEPDWKKEERNRKITRVFHCLAIQVSESVDSIEDINDSERVFKLNGSMFDFNEATQKRLHKYLKYYGCVMASCHS